MDRRGRGRGWREGYGVEVIAWESRPSKVHVHVLVLVAQRFDLAILEWIC
jgi:hypothetical protein